MTDTTETPRSLAPVAFGLSIAGFVPIPGVIASIAAVICGGVALSDAASAAERTQARLAVLLGVVGVALPLLFLLVYCVVLGYPFPIHRYQPER